MKNAKGYIIVGLICLIVGFLVGYIPLSMKRAELRNELQESGKQLKSVYDRLDVSEPYRIALNEVIGAYEAATNNNFGIAHDRVVSALDRTKPLAEKGISPWAEAAGKRDQLVSALSLIHISEPTRPY